MEEYYVYGLMCPESLTPFYIGKGKGGRYKEHLNGTDGNNGRKVSKIKEIRERGLEVDVYFYIGGISENEAFAEERRLITQFGRKHIDEGGILCNLSLGGAGGDTSDFFTDESRKKISRAKSGVNNHMAKLSVDDVMDIYYSDESTECLSERYGVSTTQIYGVKTKRHFMDILKDVKDLPDYYKGKKRVRVPIPIDLIENIFTESGTFEYFWDMYHATPTVVKNIKRKKSYTKYTSHLSSPGQVARYNLTNDDIYYINNSEEKHEKLAKRFGVCTHTIGNIKCGRTRLFDIDDF